MVTEQELKDWIKNQKNAHDKLEKEKKSEEKKILKNCYDAAIEAGKNYQKALERIEETRDYEKKKAEEESKIKRQQEEELKKVQKEKEKKKKELDKKRLGKDKQEKGGFKHLDRPDEFHKKRKKP